MGVGYKDFLRVWKGKGVSYAPRATHDTTEELTIDLDTKDAGKYHRGQSYTITVSGKQYSAILKSRYTFAKRGYTRLRFRAREYRKVTV